MSPRSARLARLLAALLPLGLVVAGASPATAVVRNWANAAGGSAGIASNWSPAGVPTSADALVIPLAGAYTITFPSASVPLVSSHDYRTGAVATISTDGVHTSTGSFGIGQLSSAGVNVTGGSFRVRSLFLGITNAGYGRLTLMNVPIFPAPPSPTFQLTDSTQGGTYGGEGKARVEILGGSSLVHDGFATLGGTTSSRCTLTVSGRNASSLAPSSFITTHPIRGRVQIPGGGYALVRLDNGGLMRSAGDVLIASNPDVNADVIIGGNTTVVPPTFVAERNLRIGNNAFGTLAAGSGRFYLVTGHVTVGGLLVFGDSESADIGTLRQWGGTLIASGGFQRVVPSSWLLYGGIQHFHAGAVAWPGTVPWVVSSQVGSPQLWFGNGQVTDYNGSMTVARGGEGTVRVVRPGTILHTTQFTIADSAGGVGVVDVDSSGTLQVGGPFASGTLSIGQLGVGTVSVRNGGSIDAVETRIGPGGVGHLLVSGAGSEVSADTMWTASATSDLTVDSLGVVDLSGGYLGLLNTSTNVRNGGRLSARRLRFEGTLSIADGELQTNSLDGTTVSETGTLVGTGNVLGRFTNHGSCEIGDGMLGTLDVTGPVLLGSLSRVAITLDRSAGPTNDALVGAASVELHGTLDLEEGPAFTQVPGDTFVIVTGSTVSGSFDAVTWDGGSLPAGVSVVYQPNRTLVVMAGPPAAVDATDLPTTLAFHAVGTPGAMEFALDLPDEADVRVTLHDVSGRRVAEIWDGPLAAGIHRLDVRRSFSAGVYFARATVLHARGGTVRVAKVAHRR